MKMNKIKGFLASMLTITLAFGGINIAVAEELPECVTLVEEKGTENYVIDSFEDFNIIEHTLYVSEKNRPQEQEIVERMPETLGVYIGNKHVKVPVTWKCATGDYEEARYYAYQFNPVLSYGYELADESIKKDMPYVAVFVESDLDDGEIIDGGIMAVTTNANEPKVYDFIIQNMGLNSAVACGIMANIKAESGFRTTALGDNGTSFGLCQWHNSRWDNLKAYCNSNGYDSTTLEGQMNFLQYELKKDYKGLYELFQKEPNTNEGAYDAAYRWCYDFERPANKAEVSVTRGNTAKNTFWPEYGKKSEVTPTTGATSTPGATVTATISVPSATLNPVAGDVMEQVNLITKSGIKSAYVIFRPDFANENQFFSMSSAGNKAPLNKKLTKKGFVFKGWFLGDKKVTAINEKNISNGMELKAKFIPVVYNINYKMIKPAGVKKLEGKIPMSAAEKKVPYTSGYFVAKGKEISAPGYILSGWSIFKNSTVPMVGVDERAKLDDLLPEKGKNINLYPVWKVDEEAEYRQAYENFVKGKIKDTDGNDINYYLEQPFDHVYYYFIKANGAQHEAMVICCETAWTGNYIYYYENGEMKCKGTFGRRAISGSCLYAQTYILYDTTLPCQCDISEVDKLTENYDVVNVKKFYRPVEACADGHFIAMEGYEKLPEDSSFGVRNYVEKYLGVTGTELYTAPEYAIKIK